jgi:hypothetical protein
VEKLGLKKEEKGTDESISDKGTYGFSMIPNLSHSHVDRRDVCLFLYLKKKLIFFIFYVFKFFDILILKINFKKYFFKIKKIF